MKNQSHKLMYQFLGEKITDKQMCDELIKKFKNENYGYFSNLSIQDICNWLISIKNRIE